MDRTTSFVMPGGITRMFGTFDVPRIRTRSVDRLRLRSQLGSGATRPSLVLVHGAAGSGKSTLLAQWAGSVELDDHEVLQWVTLREDDAGEPGFWNRVSQALTRNGLLTHVLGSEVLAQLGTPEAPPPPPAPGLPLTLVLDDYHLVSSPAIDEQLHYLLRNFEGLRLAIGTREVGGLHTAQFAASTETVVLTTKKLAFTIDESEELAALLGFGDVPGLARRVHDASAGWPLATHALLLETRRDPDNPGTIAALAHTQPQFIEDFVDEFVSKVLASLGSAEADFLLASSIADECTAQLAADITTTSLQEATVWLDQLEAAGVGTWQVRSEVRWFRMHPLLRQGFLREASGRLGSDRLSQVRGILSGRVRKERPLLAIELATAMEDWARFEAAYMLSYTQLYNVHRRATNAMIAQVPESVLRTRPALAALRLGYTFGSTGGSLGELNRLFAMVREALRSNPLTTVGIMGALQTTAVMCALRIMGDGPGAQELAGRVLALIDQSPRSERLANAQSLLIAYVEVANTYLVNGMYDAAIDALTLARHSASNGPASAQFLSMSTMALVYAVRGNISMAREWIEACDALPSSGWFVSYYDSGYYIAKAICALNDLDYEGVLTALTVPRSRERVLEFWPLIAMLDARVTLSLSNARDAYAEFAATLARKRSRPPVTRWVKDDLAALGAELLILDGQPLRAAEALGPVRNDEAAIVLLLRAKLARQRQDLERAIVFADDASWASADSYRVRTEAMIAVADVALEMGDAQRAAESFAAAIAIIRRRGSISSLLAVSSERLRELADVTQRHGQRIDRSVFDGLPVVAHTSRRVEPLTGAERRVLKALLDGGDIAAVAEQLHLSEHTVRYHVKRTYPKLGVNSRAEALLVAQELGLLG